MPSQMRAWAKALFEAQLCQMTVDVLMRIDETASDEETVFRASGIRFLKARGSAVASFQECQRA